MHPATDPDDHTHDASAALRLPDFRLLIGANFLVSFAQGALSILVGWELYQRTGSALALGLVGLVQIVPNVLFSIPAGQLVDRHDQQRIAVLATALMAAAAGMLTFLAATTGPLALIYAALFIIGIGRAFRGTTRGALMAAIVPPAQYANASAWNGGSGQAATILGPALGGFGVAITGQTAPVFAVAAALLVLAALALGRMRSRLVTKMKERITVESLFGGIRFIWRTPVLMAAITLDMVAVLLGGVTALLPIFAEDVLQVGASGLGLLRAAPAVGSVLMSLAIVRHGPFRYAGPTILFAVAGFGLATILFGLSRSLALSLLALALLGACDAVSVVIRHTMQLTYTPDEMRGRVSAIHYLFVGLSNEFGEFESGVLAALFGATAAVVIGGFGTLLVVPLIALAWPQVRHLHRIEAPSPPAPSPLATTATAQTETV